MTLTLSKVRIWPSYANTTSFVMLGRMPAERSGWPTISRCSRLAEYGSTARFLLRTLRQPVGSVRLALRMALGHASGQADTAVRTRAYGRSQLADT
jgi:hypothetical protein